MPIRNPLRDHLLDAARETARAAVDVVDERGRLQVSTAAVHAGMSVEFLLRAAVANVAPALLFVSRTQSPGAVLRVMVTAQQQHELDLGWVHQQRSADASAIRDAAELLIPGLMGLRDPITTLVKLRDSTVHMYSAEAADVRQAAATLGRVVTLVLSHLDADPEVFWGSERHALLDALMQEQDDAVRAEVAVRVHACSLKMQQMLARLTHSNAEYVFQQIEARGPGFVPLGWVSTIADCPACERAATVWVKGEYHFDTLNDIIVDFDDDGTPLGALVPQAVAAAHLECPVCGLSLNDAELAAVYPYLRDADLAPASITVGEYTDIAVTYEPF